MWGDDENDGGRRLTLASSSLRWWEFLNIWSHRCELEQDWSYYVPPRKWRHTRQPPHSSPRYLLRMKRTWPAFPSTDLIMSFWSTLSVDVAPSNKNWPNLSIFWRIDKKKKHTILCVWNKAILSQDSYCSLWGVSDLLQINVLAWKLSETVCNSTGIYVFALGFSCTLKMLEFCLGWWGKGGGENWLFPTGSKLKIHINDTRKCRRSSLPWARQHKDEFVWVAPRVFSFIFTIGRPAPVTAASISRTRQK